MKYYKLLLMILCSKLKSGVHVENAASVKSASTEEPVEIRVGSNNVPYAESSLESAPPSVGQPTAPKMPYNFNINLSNLNAENLERNCMNSQESDVIGSQSSDSSLHSDQNKVDVALSAMTLNPNPTIDAESVDSGDSNRFGQGYSTLPSEAKNLRRQDRYKRLISSHQETESMERNNIYDDMEDDSEMVFVSIYESLHALQLKEFSIQDSSTRLNLNKAMLHELSVIHNESKESINRKIIIEDSQNKWNKLVGEFTIESKLINYSLELLSERKDGVKNIQSEQTNERNELLSNPQIQNTLMFMELFKRDVKKNKTIKCLQTELRSQSLKLTKLESHFNNEFSKLTKTMGCKILEQQTLINNNKNFIEKEVKSNIDDIVSKINNALNVNNEQSTKYTNEQFKKLESKIHYCRICDKIDEVTNNIYRNSNNLQNYLNEMVSFCNKNANSIKVDAKIINDFIGDCRKLNSNNNNFHSSRMKTISDLFKKFYKIEEHDQNLKDEIAQALGRITISEKIDEIGKKYHNYNNHYGYHCVQNNYEFTNYLNDIYSVCSKFPPIGNADILESFIKQSIEDDTKDSIFKFEYINSTSSFIKKSLH